MTSSVVIIEKPRIDRLAVSEDELTVELTDGRTVIVPIAWYPRLQYATPAERSKFELIGDGTGVHWTKLDEDISSENLVLGQPSGESQKSFARWLEARSQKKKRKR